jgi:hypothetical protein
MEKPILEGKKTQGILREDFLPKPSAISMMR